MIRGPLSRPREDFGMVALLINGFATLLWERRSKVTCRESASFFSGASKMRGDLAIGGGASCPQDQAKAREA